jgi:uncharacterized membrane protein YcjF (UPF0283 family)
MDHHEQHRQHHDKQREHEKKEHAAHAHNQKRRRFHPTILVATGLLLVLIAVLIWTFLIW